LIAFCSFVTAACGNSAVGPEQLEELPVNAATDEPPADDHPSRDGASILIDASRDGGVWWYPQSSASGGFDPDQPHQGSALAAYLRERGHVVHELPRPHTITRSLLDSYEIVIRANAFSGYTSDEVAAYRGYVDGGGGLLLLSDHMRFAAPDQVGASFGIVFAGLTRGAQLLDSLEEHAISRGVGPLSYLVGSAIVAAPESATIVGRLTLDGWADMDFDEVKGDLDVVAPAVLGAMKRGRGRIVFSGDTNMWQTVPRPLVGNVLEWLAES